MHSFQKRNRLQTCLIAVPLSLAVLAVGAGTASAQTRTCNLTSQPVPLTLLSGDAGVDAFTSGTFIETGPFLATPGQTTAISAGLQFVPPASTTPAWLLAPILETMGDCEGPPSFPTIGNGGTSTHDFGVFGTVVDRFTVTASGNGPDPDGYQISHALTGALNLTGLPAINPQAVIERDADITLSHTSATGTIDIVAVNGDQRQVLIHGKLSAQYTTAPEAITAKIRCVKRVPFTSFNPASGLATGTVNRTYTILPPVPAIPPAGVFGLAALALSLGLWAIRQSLRARSLPIG